MAATPICHFWRAGSCRNGDSCKFSHSPAEYNTVPLPTKSGTATPTLKRSLSPTSTPPPEKRLAGPPPAAVPPKRPTLKRSGRDLPSYKAPLSPTISPKYTPLSAAEAESSGGQTIFAVLYSQHDSHDSSEAGTERKSEKWRKIIAVSSTIERANGVLRGVQAGSERFRRGHEWGVEGDGRMWIRDLIGNEVVIEKWEVDKGASDLSPDEEEGEEGEEWEERLDWEAEGDGDDIDFGLS